MVSLDGRPPPPEARRKLRRVVGAGVGSGPPAWPQFSSSGFAKFARRAESRGSKPRSTDSRPPSLTAWCFSTTTATRSGQREAFRFTGVGAETPSSRVLSVRPRLGRAWGGYLASLRSRFGYQELVELLPLRDDRLVVFAAGEIHCVDLGTKVIERTHRLRYFGPGKGRGLMAFGLTRRPNRGDLLRGVHHRTRRAPGLRLEEQRRRKELAQSLRVFGGDRPSHPHGAVRPVCRGDLGRDG